jgi:hypothetical protein
VVYFLSPHMGAKHFEPITMRNRRDRRGLKPPSKALHRHSTAISCGQIDDLRQGVASGCSKPTIAAPDAPNPRIWAPGNTSKGVAVLGFGTTRL